MILRAPQSAISARTRRALLLLASPALLGACAASVGTTSAATSPMVAASPSGRGTLFIVGGGPQPPALVREFVDLAGGSRARIVVFAMASEEGA
jgi:hypothetical protein